MIGFGNLWPSRRGGEGAENPPLPQKSETPEVTRDYLLPLTDLLKEWHKGVTKERDYFRSPNLDEGERKIVNFALKNHMTLFEVGQSIALTQLPESDFDFLKKHIEQALNEGQKN